MEPEIDTLCVVDGNFGRNGMFGSIEGALAAYKPIGKGMMGWVFYDGKYAGWAFTNFTPTHWQYAEN